MNKNNILILIAVIVVFSGIYYYSKIEKAKKQEEENQPEPTSAPTKKTTTTTTAKGIDRYKVLSLGSKGKEVVLIQKILAGYSLGNVKPDGIFGKKTESYLISYKSNNKIGGAPNKTSVAELNADGQTSIFKPF